MIKMYRTSLLSLIIFIFFIPSVTQAQSSNDESIFRSALCHIFGVMCPDQPEMSAQNLDELLRQASSREPEKYGAFMQSIRSQSDAIKQGGVQSLVDQGKPQLDELFREAEKALTEDLGAETMTIVENCFGAAKALRDVSVTKTSGATPQTRIDTSNAKACTDAVMKREQEVSTELNKKDSEIKQLDKEIESIEQKRRVTDDPEERRKLQEEKKKKEKARADKERERAKLERERKRLQQMRMMIGLALIIAGLAVGGPAGMMLIAGGLNMLTPPSGGDKEGRSNHPSSNEVVAEEEGGTKPADIPSPPSKVKVIGPVAEDDVSPDPSFVEGAVPVSKNKYSNQGYYIENYANDAYILRHTKKVKFKIIIDPSLIKPGYVEPGQDDISVPNPFIIKQFVALAFDKNHNVQIIVKLKGIDKQRAIVQNPPTQPTPGLYLSNPIFPKL